jgi:hypothetical protein
VAGFSGGPPGWLFQGGGDKRRYPGRGSGSSRIQAAFSNGAKKILYKLNKENPELKVKRIRLRIVDNLEQSPPSYSREKQPEPKIQTVKKRRDGQSPGDAFLEAMKEEKPE